MTVLYVDNEHERVLHDPVRGPAHHAKLEVARDRIAAAAGESCTVMRFGEISPGRLQQVSPTAAVLSGNATGWEQYEFKAFEGLLAAIRAAPVPILGICGGHELIGYAHGAKWGPLGPLQEGEVDPDPSFGSGQRKERGFLPVQVDLGCPLFRGLDATARFSQSHYWQLQEVPAGFIVRASSPYSPIQAIERLDQRVFGVQFHPERYNAAHRSGKVVLRNFFNLVRGH